MRLHVKLDSDGSEDGDGTATVGASVLVSEPTTAAPSNVDKDQPLNLNPILHLPSSSPNSSSKTTTPSRCRSAGKTRKRLSSKRRKGLVCVP
jgi:hypothetical protein